MGAQILTPKKNKYSDFKLYVISIMKNLRQLQGWEMHFRAT